MFLFILTAPIKTDVTERNNNAPPHPLLITIGCAINKSLVCQQQVDQFRHIDNRDFRIAIDIGADGTPITATTQ